MDIDVKTKKALENLIYCGIVCEQNAKAGTVKVTREDKGNKVTGELFVLQRGTKATKDFWMPAINDAVLCIQLPNYSGKGTGEGFVLGAFYSSVDKPVEDNPDVRSVHFSDGSFIKSDGGGNIEILAKGKFTVNAANIFLNES